MRIPRRVNSARNINPALILLGHRREFARREMPVNARLRDARSDGRHEGNDARRPLEAPFLSCYCDPVDLLIELSVSLVASCRTYPARVRKSISTGRNFLRYCRSERAPGGGEEPAGGREGGRISPVASQCATPVPFSFSPRRPTSDVGRGIDRSTRAIGGDHPERLARRMSGGRGGGERGVGGGGGGGGTRPK